MVKTEKLPRKNLRDIMPLTPTQEGMLYHYLLEPESGLYHEQLCLVVSGEIDLSLFEKTWDFLIKTNEMLRTVFRWREVKDPVQITLEKYNLPVKYYDFSTKDEEIKKKLWETLKFNDRNEPFDLNHVPLRVKLGKIKKNEYEMIITHHHILYDGWTTGIILREFFSIYRRLAAGNQLIEPSKTKFKEYLRWLQKANKHKQEHFWKKYFQGFTARTEIPFKKNIGSTALKSRDTGNCRVEFSSDFKQRLEKFIGKNRVTVAALFYSAWGILLQKCNNSSDVVFGTTVSGRTAAINGIENIVGMFINTLPLRINNDGDQKVVQLVKKVDSDLRVRREYESTPLVKIRQFSDTSSKEELFESIMVIENYPLDKGVKKGNWGLSIRSYSVYEVNHYALTAVVELFDQFSLRLIYNRKLFDQESISRMAGYFLALLQGSINFSTGRIRDIEFISSEEKKLLLEDFNDTRTGYPKEKTLHQLFQDQGEQSPDRAALVYKHKQLTYRELNKKANQLAQWLNLKGVGGDSLVALMIERSVEMMIGLLGILKAGGAYLPLEPGYPKARLDYILEDTSIRLVLTQQRFRERWGSTVQVIDLEDSECYQGKPWNLEKQSTAINLAYIIYTSGSTGKPKGVMIQHRSVVNRLIWMQRLYPLDYTDVILQKTPFSFDVSVWELFWWALNGARVCFLEPGAEKDPGIISEVIAKNRITTMHFVPSMLNVFLEYIEISLEVKKLSSLRRLFASGEALGGRQVEIFNRLLRDSNGTRLVNLYGPTEAAIDVSYFDCSNVDKNETIPIGKPIDNIKLYILDKNLGLQPIGVKGELYISGDGLARGYLNQPELTAQKFQIPNKPEYYRSYKPYILYKTGDLARWLPEGDIEFLGRSDNQVKIRGFRIELGEIENRLLDHEDIGEALVTAKKDKNREQRLAAYFISEKDIPPHELRAFLLNRLPHYMLPDYFIRIPGMPLTSNGKVNRSALPKPGEIHREIPGTTAIPRTDLEKTIAHTWGEVLQIDQVGRHNNFFDLGGNSILITRVNNRLKKILVRDIPVTVMFKYSTVASLADYLEAGEGGAQHTTPELKQRAPAKDEEGERETGREIAVIGMAGRFPGAKDINEFWNNLKNGVESISFFSDQELEEAGIDSRLLNNPDYVKAKGVLSEFDFFDASFFDYLPVQVQIMDPQVRLLHEVCWGALENSGYNPGSYKGLIGLYAGAANNFPWIHKLFSPETSFAEQFEMLNLNSQSFTTLISYKLGINGPSISLNTACSTSLVAVDIACRDLLDNKCQMALAGGVSITFPPISGYLYQEGMVRSADGHCRAFSAEAGGTVDGNGVGVVLLKRLGDAIKDRDHIYAMIKGIAVNNDGNRKIGFTAPSIHGQAEVIAKALHMAKVEPQSIGYIETHGTGTRLGDPVEIEGLKLAFNSTGKIDSCPVGSIKTNIGHLNEAAGIASLIKIILALTYKQIPPGLNFEIPNPRIDFKNSPFYVNTGLSIWKNNGRPLRAAVSSFGIGGTNVHAVLEEWPDAQGVGCGTQGEPGQYRSAVSPPSPSREYQLILLSAKTRSALERASMNFVEFLDRNPGINLADAAYTLQNGRYHFEHRKMAVCSNRDEAIKVLSTGLEKGYRHLSGQQKPSVVFMFPGQGPQYVNMGLELYQKEPLFRGEMDRCFTIFKEAMGFDIKRILYPGETGNEPAGKDSNEQPLPGIHQTAVTQPVLFIIEYGLARLLIQWGIHPDAMIGYSFGEYVAACLSGIFSLTDALKLVAIRGKLMQEMPRGAMLSVPLPESDLIPLLDDEISIAIVNGPSCVVSGPSEAIRVFEGRLKANGYLCIPVGVSHGSHSVMMDSILTKFEKELKKVKPGKPALPLISNLSGDWLTPRQAVSTDYWVRHMRETVRFDDGIKQLLKKGNSIFVEIGPGRDLSVLLNRYLEDNPRQKVVSTLRPPQKETSDIGFLLDKIGKLWLFGVDVDWEQFYAREKRCRIPLPSYSFDRQRYWLDDIPARVSAGKTAIADWFYLRSWKRTVLQSQPGKAMGHERWLVFTGEGTLASQLMKSLEKTGPAVIAVGWGKSFAAIKEDSFTINPGDPHDYENLLRELKRLNRIPNRVLHLGGVTREKHTDEESILRTGFYSLLYLAQALGKHGAENLRIDVITNNMQEAAGDEETCPAKSTILGAVKVIPQEYRNINCRSIDIVLPTAGGSQEKKLVHHLLQELSTDSPGRIIAYRGNVRYLESFEPVLLENNQSRGTGLKEKGIYLITGGVGEIGLTLAEYLAHSVRARLVLVSRSLFPPRRQWTQWKKASERVEEAEEDRTGLKIKKILEMESRGAEILILNADAADLQQMQTVIKKAEKHFGPIDGVIHAAGVMNENTVCSVEHTTRAQCEEQFQAKLYALPVLERVLANKPLDFCLLASSMVSVLGGLGHISYTAANISMDAFVQRHNSHHPVHWMSVNWDSWKFSEGKSKNSPLAINLVKHFMTPEQGIETFKHVLAMRQYNQVFISVGDLSARLRQWITFQFQEHPPGTGKKKNIPPLEPRQELDTVERKELSNWFYIPVWEPGIDIHMNRKPRALTDNARWLVFIHNGDFGNQLVKRLQDLGRTVIVVERGDGFIKKSDNGKKSIYKINPRDPGDYESLFSQLVQRDAVPGFIIHMWGITGTGREEKAPLLERLEESQLLGLYSLIYLAKAISSRNITRKIQIEVITDSMQPVNGDDGLNPEKATVIAPVKIIPLEYPHLKCRGIDIVLPPPGSWQEEKLIEKLLDEFISGPRENEPVAAFRGSYRWRLTMKPVLLDKAGTPFPLLKEKGIYLITGGFGGLGFTFARHLARNLKARLILLGRSPLPPGEEGEAKVKQLQEWGADVIVYRCDVCSEQQVQVAVSEAKKRFGEINGVFHAAGTADLGGIIQNRTRETIDKYMAAKVQGTLVLDKVMEGEALDFFILFSSAGSVTHHHKLGQVAYLAACEFLDTFSYYKMAQSHTYFTAIGWNDWQKVGMAVESLKYWAETLNSDPAALLKDGILPGEGIEVLHRILNHRFPRVVVSTEDIFRKFRRGEAVLKRTLKGGLSNALQRPRPDLSTEYLEPVSDLEKKLVNIWQRFFNLQPIGTMDDFFELGGDSLKAMIIISQIHKMLDVQVSLANFFLNPTIKSITTHIKQSIKTGSINIEPIEQKEYYALSFTQKRLFVLQSLQKNTVSYNEFQAFLLEGKLEKEKLKQSFQNIIKRNEPLRTSFKMVNGIPVQEIADDEMGFEIEWYAPGRDAGGQGGPQWTANLIKGFIRPFDLSRPPLLRVGIIPLHTSPFRHPSQEGNVEDKHILMVDMHHIITDAVSNHIVIHELMARYRREALPALAIQYKDYAEWQNREEYRSNLGKQEKYWLKEFQGKLPVLDLPMDFPRPGIWNFEGSRVSFEIDSEQTKALKKLALEKNLTLYMILLAAFNILLSKLAGQEDIIIGTAKSARQHPDLQNMMGMFINTLVLRNYPSGEKTVEEFLLEVKERTLKAFENQDYPFDELVKKLAIKPVLNRSPLYDIGFSLNTPDPPLTPGDAHEKEVTPLKIKRYEYPSTNWIVKIDLGLQVNDIGDQLLLYVEYSTQLFKPRRIEMYIEYFRHIVTAVLENPRLKIWEIDIMGKEEKDTRLKKIRDENYQFIKVKQERPLKKLEADFDY